MNKKQKSKDKSKDNKYKETSVIEDIKHRIGKEESDYSKVAYLLLNEQFKRRKTALNDVKQFGLLASLDVIAQIYDIPFLRKYVDYYMELLTSINARGRTDIVDISKFRFEEQSKLNNQLLELARGK